MTPRWLIAAFWASFATAAVVYLVMVLWSLPKIAAEAGGAMPFDMRPAGYTLEDAQAFLTALSPEGNAFYRETQHRLDSLYPPLLEATLGLGLWIMAPCTSPWLRASLALFAVPGMVFDLTENLLVADMLMSQAGSPDAELAMLASAATVLKSVFTTLAMSLLLILTGWWAWKRWRRI